MKILLVNQHTVPVFADIARAFATTGHKVSLFAGYVEEGSQPLGNQVTRFRSARYRRTSSTTRLISWMAFVVHYAFHLLIRSRPDHILVTTNPPLAPIITRLVAGFRGIPYHVLVYDLYPEALSQAGFMSSKSPLYRAWQRWNKKAFRHATGVVTLSESMKVAVSAYAEPAVIHVISNWSDTRYIKPIPKSQNSFAALQGLAGKIVVMYSGNMGLTHDLESLMEAARLIKDPRCTFVLIGEGGKKKKLVDMKLQYNLDNVLFLDYQDSVQFPMAVAAADIGIVTLGTGAEGISVPSKTYISLAAGQCLIAICPPESELARIVSEFGVGYTVEPKRPTDLAGRIADLLDHPEKLSAFKNQARATSMKFTSAIADEYVKLICPPATVPPDR